MSVLQFPTDRRATAHVEQTAHLTCPCGSTWFELCSVGRDGQKIQGAVVLTATGNVSGYTGTPHCLECGRENIP